MESTTSSDEGATLDFLVGGGEMGRRIRGHDWTSTSLGPPDAWPQSLRSALSICLHSTFPTAIYWGTDLRLLYNDSWSPIPAERHPWALGRPAAEVWADIWDVIGPQLEQVLSSGQGFATFDQMLPMVRDGRPQETYWNYSFTPIRGEDGSVVGVFNQGNDITDRVLAERRNTAQTDRMQRMFDQAPGFMAMLRSPEHVFEFVNPAYMQLIGHRDVVGKTVRDALPEVAGQGFLELLDGVYSSGQPFVGRALSVELQRSPGAAVERRFVDLVYQPVTDASGAVAGIFVEGSDVTERETAEAELRESLARYRALLATSERKAAELRAILESMPDAVYIGSVDGITLANQPALDQLGFSSHEELNRHIGTLADEIQTRDAETGAPISAERQAFARALGGERIVQDVRVRHRLSGEERIVRCAASPVVIDGEVIAAVAVNTDVTQQRLTAERLRELNETLEQRVAQRTAELQQAEEALRQSQKLEAMGQLTGGVAHDFNNLLTPIIGGLDMLQRRGVGDERARRQIDGALQSADRAKTLVQRLLAFARRQPLQPTAVNVGSLVEGMADLVASTSGPRVKVELNVAPDLPAAYADGNQLEMAILNLSVNARDAMPDGGRLSIAASEERTETGHRSKLPPGRYVRLSVSDTGVGMDDAIMARAVEPFFSTKGIGQGTGLGLSMVHGLASQLGGALTINSKPAVGTCVELWLPVSVAPVAAERAEDSRIAASNRAGTVLLVDDEELVRISTTDMLIDLGYAVVEARSAEEALRMIDDGILPDILVTDHLMPGMTGTDLARAVRERIANLPVLIVSGYSEDDGIAPDLPRLIKPFREADLVASLAKLAPPGKA